MPVGIRFPRRSRWSPVTVELSGEVFAVIDETASDEGTTVATIVRRAVMLYLMELREEELEGCKLKPLNLEEFEEQLRIERRGLPRQWPQRVHYGMPDHLMRELRDAAGWTGQPIDELAREGVIRHVCWSVREVPRREQTRDRNGWVHLKSPVSAKLRHRSNARRGRRRK